MKGKKKKSSIISQFEKSMLSRCEARKKTFFFFSFISRDFYSEQRNSQTWQPLCVTWLPYRCFFYLMRPQLRRLEPHRPWQGDILRAPLGLTASQAPVDRISSTNFGLDQTLRRRRCVFLSPTSFPYAWFLFLSPARKTSSLQTTHDKGPSNGEPRQQSFTTKDGDAFQHRGGACNPSSDTKKLATQTQAFIRQLQYNKLQQWDSPRE